MKAGSMAAKSFQTSGHKGFAGMSTVRIDAFSAIKNERIYLPNRAQQGVILEAQSSEPQGDRY